MSVNTLACFSLEEFKVLQLSLVSPMFFLAVLVANVGGSDSLPVCRCATFHPYNGLALNVVQRFTICRR